MLRLNDFVEVGKDVIIRVGGLYLSGVKFQSHAMTLTGQCPMLKSS